MSRTHIATLWVQCSHRLRGEMVYTVDLKSTAISVWVRVPPKAQCLHRLHVKGESVEKPRWFIMMITCQHHAGICFHSPTGRGGKDPLQCWFESRWKHDGYWRAMPSHRHELLIVRNHDGIIRILVLMLNPSGHQTCRQWWCARLYWYSSSV